MPYWHAKLQKQGFILTLKDTTKSEHQVKLNSQELPIINHHLLSYSLSRGERKKKASGELTLEKTTLELTKLCLITSGLWLVMGFRCYHKGHKGLRCFFFGSFRSQEAFAFEDYHF